MKVKNNSTQGWDTITLGSVTIDNSLSGDSATHGASVHAVNQGLAGKISGDGSVEKIVRSETAPTGTEATIWIEPSDFDSTETTILKDTLEDEDLDKAPTVHAVKQAIDNVENIDYDSLPVRSKIEYTKENSWDQIPAGYTESTIPYTLEGVGEMVDGLSDMNVYPELGKEKIVGIWLDGKPIYRKTIQATLPSTPNVWTTIYSGVISNFDNVISFRGWFKSDEEIFFNLPMSEGQYFINLRLNSNGSLECIRNGWSNSIAYITLEYTKTTDKGRGVTITEEVSSSSGGAN